MGDRPTLVLVHGAWHRSWCWERVVPLLAGDGLAVVALDLPSCGGPSGHDHGTYSDDVDATAAAVDAAAPPVVLVGHSRGGLVISEAGARDGVAHLVYVAALLGNDRADVDEIYVGGRSGPAFTATRRTADGLQAFDPARAADVLYPDADPAVAAAAAARLVPMSHAPGPAREPAEAWRRVPATWVVCGRDRIVSPAMQRRWAAQVGEVVEWDCDHTPMLAQPERVAALLRTIAARV
jgi:pimeloyl-ACP methyl ester carboxylesterase